MKDKEPEEVKTVSTPRRSRRAAAAPKDETSTANALHSKWTSKSMQPEDIKVAESRPIRPQKKKDDTSDDLMLPVIRLTRCARPTESPTQDGEAKTTNKRMSLSRIKNSPEAKSVPAKRGRDHQAKSVEDVSEPVEPARRATARGKTAATIVDPGNSIDDIYSDAESKKATTRRGAAKRNVLETVPEEKKLLTAKRALDEIKTIHEDSKKTLKLQVGVAEPEVSTFPAETTKKDNLSISRELKAIIRLERDPEIETMIAAAASVDDAIPNKHPQQKKAAAAAATPAINSPAKPAPKQTRSKKSTNVSSEPEKTPPVCAPSPRRTRRTR